MGRLPEAGQGTGRLLSNDSWSGLKMGCLLRSVFTGSDKAAVPGGLYGWRLSRLRG